MKNYVFALATLVLLSACNTMEGAGEDIQAGGKHLTHSARDTQQDMRRNDAREDYRENTQNPAYDDNRY